MRRFKLRLAITVFLVTLVTLVAPYEAAAVRIKDVAGIAGMRENQLLGYGLMVGLENTGDRSYKSPFTIQTLISMLKRLGTTIDVRQLTGKNIGTSQTRNLRDVRVENIAAVMVTGMLPPFARPGQIMDISVSSLGDAKSLAGGTLLLTPLRAANGSVYAVAQGTLRKKDESRLTKRRGFKKMTTGQIQGGAIIEKGIDINFNQKASFELLLNSPDFTTANSIVDAVNTAFGKDTAQGQDAAVVKLTLPQGFEGSPFVFISQVEALQVKKDLKAKVVLDRVSGTVVVGEHVEVNNVAISFADITVQIKRRKLLAPIPPTKKEKLNVINSNANINELVKALNALGVSPQDLVSIFKSLRASGALNAELEILS